MAKEAFVEFVRAVSDNNWHRERLLWRAESGFFVTVRDRPGVDLGLIVPLGGVAVMDTDEEGVSSGFGVMLSETDPGKAAVTYASALAGPTVSH